MEAWKRIWENRNTSFISENEKDTLLKLIQVDGFDGGGGHSCITVDSWMSYIAMITKELSIQASDTVFEVGCGSGAMLYPFYKAGHGVGGLDYAENLVKKAKEVLPDSDLSACEAIDVDCQKKYDYVIANSMFFYFPDYEYASQVLNKMYEKANKGVAILDVPNARLEEALESERRKACPNYDEKYKGLKHLYYPQAWFLDFAEQKQSCKIVISQQNILNYGYNQYRFNCLLIK